MTTIRVSRCHPLGLAAARAEVDRIAQRVRDVHGAQFAWHGDMLVFRYTGVAGQIRVGPTRIDLDLRLGILLAPMRARIEARLVEKIDRALARRLAEFLPAASAVGSRG